MPERIKRYGEAPSLVPGDLPPDTTFKDARTRGKERTVQAQVESLLAGYSVEYDASGLHLGAVADIKGVYRK